jgi:cysteine desulfurase family protein
MAIYLDNAATTFPKPQEVIDAVSRCMALGAVNAGRGVYPLAHEAEKIISETRSLIRDLLNYNNGNVIFSPSATIALNQVLLGIKWSSRDVIYVTPLEHNSVTRVLENIKQNYDVEIIDIPLCSETLEYDLKETEQLFFKKPPKAVVMTHVSNVCGLITPVEEIATLAKQYDSTVVVDGCQGGPLVPLEEPQELVDFYIFSGHKTFYGPFGIAGFVTNGNIGLNPILFGGTGSHSELLSMPEEIPFRYEVGSPNIVSISGINQACKWIKKIGANNIAEHDRSLLAYATRELEQFDNLKVFVNQELSKHLGILSFIVDTYTAQEIGMILSQQFEIATRTGLHCAPMAHRFLGTLSHGTVRVGFSYYNTEDEVKLLIDAISTIVA